MTKSGMNLQDSFLNQVRKENTEIMLMLLDGTRLNGYVRGFDNFTVIMNVRGSQHLIYKHAIAQIVSRRITHGEGEAGHGTQGASSEAASAGAPGETTHAAPQEGAPRREREGGYREREREGGHREGGPRREPREEGSHRENGPREGGQREGGPREGGQRREREESNQGNKPKFNTIDFSSIKIDQEKKD